MTTEKKPLRLNLTACTSSQIHAHGHCPETNTLAIQFLRKNPDDPTGPKIGGQVYHYKGFDADAYKAFTEAESLGSHFGAHIKTAKNDDGGLKYPFEKMEHYGADEAA